MAKRQKEGSQGKNSKRGSVRNADRLGAFRERRKTTGADWGGCTPERLQSVIVAITGLGGAITFGLSRDLGAHSMTLMLDGERQTLWFNGGADLDDELAEVFATLEAMQN